jgi:carbon storage regulator
MLVLSRRVGDEIVIDDAVRVRVVAVRGSRVRLGVCAPLSVRVDRDEVHRERAGCVAGGNGATVAATVLTGLGSGV